jgi:hypothetical protein
MAEPTLTFLSWTRERIGELATSVAHGRGRGETVVILTGQDAAGAITTTATRSLAFLLAGPADVVGLKPGAIAGRHPPPGTIDAESDKCSHVEFADPALPWRYTPAGNPTAGTGSLHPWLALVVGAEGDELTLAGETVSLSVQVQQQHPLGNGPIAFPWSHVQIDDSGRRVSRVLSGRRLDPGQDYLAVLVPAFDAAGIRAWSGAAPVTLPAFDVWRFRTAQPAGSFRDLAAALDPGEADPDTGRAPVAYPRLPAAGDLQIRGALAPLGSSDAPLPPEIGTDVVALLTPPRDEAGRPVIGPPRYGDAWTADPRATGWGGALNGDPRHRGVAGLGLELGIRLQEELVAESAAHAGALGVAAQRIGDLVLGLRAARALWERRLPADHLRRLWVLGPALRRVVTEDGTVAELATAPGVALPHGLFSAAARRVLRPGPARTARARARAADPAAILEVANRCPEQPGPSEDGVPLDDVGLRNIDERRQQALDAGELDFPGLANALEALDLEPVGPRLRELAAVLRDRLVAAARESQPAPYGRGIELLLAAIGGGNPESLIPAIRELLERFEELAGSPEDLFGLLKDLDEPRGEEPPCRAVDLGRLAVGAAAAFDPTGPAAPARVRILSTIDGLDPAQPLAPTEVCPGLDRPVWHDLEGQLPEWLLPGVGRLPEDSVIALETNPAFTDALLLGYNTQLLIELRWRNHRVATGCTPLRVFWGRADTATGEALDDIRGIANWSAGSGLGDPTHRPAGASAADLVLVFRGRLFLRYPKTLIYLVSAVHGTEPDFGRDPDPDAPRVLPTFQGRIGADVTFFGFAGFPATEVRRHWVVLEEPPAGSRFYNPGGRPSPTNADGARFARETFADPVRVLIRGDRLRPGGAP